MPRHATLDALDEPTRALVLLAAVITGGSEEQVRRALVDLTLSIPPVWVEELLLQTYLFAGFPRALNATREWRRLQPEIAETDAATGANADDWRASGELTCATVYGSMYARLRENVRALHPRLDEWMIVEGYGKVLSRPDLDLARRELCIVAACAASGQDRQLHSHLHGALNAGVAADVVSATIDALDEVIGSERVRSVRLLWARVRGK